MKIERRMGADIAPILPALAHLRIAVFRDWPYLYEGDALYEERYLSVYAEAPGAVVVCVFDGDRLVAASTGCPLLAHSDDFSEAFAGTDIDPATIFYCAESVALPEARGKGLGHVFFEHREAVARDLGLSTSAFCAVVRPQDHPLRPAGYRPLDEFWRKRGYAPMPGVLAQFDWQDVGETEESPHALQFWSKAL